MDKSKLRYFKDRLLEEKKKILKTLNKMTNMEEYGSMDVYQSELSNYDNHPADMGTELFMKEQDNGFKNRMKNTLLEIESSFDDISKGSYGVCKACGEKIDEERLEIIPYAKTCKDCSEEISTLSNVEMNRRSFIPIDEDRATSFSDTTDDMVMFDREDAYQSVHQYNYVKNDPSYHTGDNQGVDDEEDHDGGDGVEEVENISHEYYKDTLK